MSASTSTRFLLLEDGRVIGCFASTTSKSALVLEASAATCSVIEQDGTIHRHRSAFPLRQFQSRLVETLRFRNRHHAMSGRRLYLCRALKNQPVPSNQSQDSFHRVIWPEELLLQEDDHGDKPRRLYSVQKNAWVQLECQGMIAHVAYLAEIPSDDDTHQSHSVTWIEAKFPVHKAPACFCYPINSLLEEQQVRQQHDNDDSDDDVRPSCEPGSSSSVLPCTSSLENEHEETIEAWTPLSTPSTNMGGGGEHLLLSVDIMNMTSCRGTEGEDGSVSSLPLPNQKQAVVMVEENDMGCFWIDVGKGEGKAKVIVQVEADDSLLIVLKNFCKRVIRTGRETKGDERQTCSLYSIEAMDHIYIETTVGQKRYNLGAIAKHANALLINYLASLVSQETSDLSQQCSLLSTLGGDGWRPGPGPLIEAAEVEGLGVFRAFENGKVLARFEDRTILELDTQNGLCTLLLPDAITLVVPLAGWADGPDAPYLYRYGRPALEFAKWAVLSPDERDEAVREMEEKKERIQHEMQKNKVYIRLNKLETLIDNQPSFIPPQDEHDHEHTRRTERGTSRQVLEVIEQLSARNRAQMERNLKT